MQNIQQKNQRGMITLVMTLMLMLIISIVILLVAKSSKVEQRISANEFGADQAFIAAQTGLQYAIPYLVANRTTIVKDTDNNGYIDTYTNSNTNNVVLSNGASYNITYSNPQQNNLNVIRIQSTGTSANGATTRTVTQLVQNYNSGMPHPGNVGLVAKNIVNLSGNVEVTNTVTNQTVHSGGIINSSGSVDLTTRLGTSSSPYNPVSGANMNNTDLQDATNDQLFKNFFGVSMPTMQNRADLYYSNGGNFSSTLNGVTGKIIYISGSANFSSNAVIGSETQPVIIIADGSINISGTVTIYGFVYATQGVNLSGTANFIGVAAGASNFNVSGSVDVTYSGTVVNNLSQQWQTYVPIAGSWRDF